MKEAKKAAGEHRSSCIFLALFTHLHHGNLCQVIYIFLLLYLCILNKVCLYLYLYEGRCPEGRPGKPTAPQETGDAIYLQTRNSGS